MAETARERLAQRELTSGQILAFLRAGPYAPKATRDQVLEIPCSFCDAKAGALCDTRFPRPTLIDLVLLGMSGIHLRRYLDRTHDPR